CVCSVQYFLFFLSLRSNALLSFFFLSSFFLLSFFFLSSFFLLSFFFLSDVVFGRELLFPLVKTNRIEVTSTRAKQGRGENEMRGEKMGKGLRGKRPWTNRKPERTGTRT